MRQIELRPLEPRSHSGDEGRTRPASRRMDREARVAARRDLRSAHRRRAHRRAAHARRRRVRARLVNSEQHVLAAMLTAIVLASLLARPAVFDRADGARRGRCPATSAARRGAGARRDAREPRRARPPCRARLGAVSPLGRAVGERHGRRPTAAERRAGARHASSEVRRARRASPRSVPCGGARAVRARAGAERAHGGRPLPRAARGSRVSCSSRSPRRGAQSRPAWRSRLGRESRWSCSAYARIDRATPSATSTPAAGRARDSRSFASTRRSSSVESPSSSTWMGATSCAPRLRFARRRRRVAPRAWRGADRPARRGRAGSRPHPGAEPGFSRASARAPGVLRAAARVARRTATSARATRASPLSPLVHRRRGRRLARVGHRDPRADLRSRVRVASRPAWGEQERSCAGAASSISGAIERDEELAL